MGERQRRLLQQLIGIEMRQRAGKAANLSCVQFNLSPRGFHAWANEYLDSHQDSVPAAQPSPARHLLLCRVMELEFKAWHRQMAKTKLLTDAFGHDLVGSYHALPAKHRVLSEKELALLTVANDVYSKADFACFDAGRVDQRRMPRVDLDGLEALAKKLMKRGDGLHLAHG